MRARMKGNVKRRVLLPTLERPASATSGRDEGGNCAAVPHTAKRKARKGGVVADMLAKTSVEEEQRNLKPLANLQCYDP
jgi:hypothetical protein